MSWLIRALRGVACFALAATATGLAAGAWAMDVRSCEDPRVFADTPVNVLLLPYTYGAEPDRPASPAARHLGVLIQQDSLFEMVKYERIAIVNLVAPPSSRDCVPEEIWERMTGRGRDTKGVRARNGLVMIWGRIYEEGDELYVQSYLRFARVDVAETIETAAKPGYGSDAVFSGALPTREIAFPPRKISREDLRRISTAFAQSAEVHAEANARSPVKRISPDPNKFEPFGYYVSEVRPDGWMRVQPFYAGPSGWIRARVDAAAWPLRERMPELHFLDAVVGYLQYRIASETKAPRPAFVGYVRASVERYDQAAVERATSRAALPSALGQAMIAALEFLDGGTALSRVDERLSAAIAQVPYSAELRNMRNVVRIARCCAGASPEAAVIRTAWSDLTGAVAADPESATALANLGSLHRLLPRWPLSPEAIGADEIARQRAALRAAGVTLPAQ